MRPIAVLTRHFFDRLFQNEVFPFEDQMKEKLYVAGAFLTVLGGHVSNVLFMKYMFVADAGTSWTEKTFFLGFFMAVLAVVVVLDWDILFPDPRDYANLTVLPIRLRTIFGAKFLSALVFIGLYTLAVNAFAVFVVVFFLPKWRSESIGFLFRYVGAHLVATAAAFLFVFFLFVLVQAILLLALPSRLYKRLSLILRFAILVVLIFVLMAFIVQSPLLGRVSSSILEARAAGTAATLRIPPLWFVALYETLLGDSDPQFQSLARAGLFSIALLALAYFGAMGLTYRRHTRRTGEVGRNGARLWHLRDRALGFVERAASRDRVQQGVLRFIADTLRTGSRQRLQIVGFLALALGLDMILLSAGAFRPGAVGAFSRAFLAAPIILAFWLLLGFRSAFAIPEAAEANWIFRLTEADHRRHYHFATRKAVVLFGLIPLVGATFAVSLLVMDPGRAALHGAYVLTVSLLGLELIFHRFAKIPFSCLSLPGTKGLQFTWIFYLLGFILGVSLLAEAERAFLTSSPGAFAAFFVSSGIFLGGLWILERKILYDRLPIVYEESPEPVMIGLSSF
jgi:hypothetical protein